MCHRKYHWLSYIAIRNEWGAGMAWTPTLCVHRSHSEKVGGGPRKAGDGGSCANHCGPCVTESTTGCPILVFVVTNDR